MFNTGKPSLMRSQPAIRRQFSVPEKWDCRGRCRRRRLRRSGRRRRGHRARSGRQGRHPGEGARGPGRRQHAGRRPGLSEHIVGRESRRLSHRAVRTLHRAGAHGAGVGGGDVPQQCLARKPRRRSAGASASAGRHRIPRPARLGLRAQIPRRADLRLFLHLEAVRAPGQAAPDPASSTKRRAGN